jgi:hypothetical protein
MRVRLVAAAAAVVLLLAVVVALTWSGAGTDPDGDGGTASPGASPTGAATTPPDDPPDDPADDPAGDSAQPPGTPAPQDGEAPPGTGESESLPAAGGPSAEQVVEVRYRLERRTADAATEGFADVVEQTLSDPRGWSRAGFRLVRDDAPSVPFVVVLAEPDEVDRLCHPYDTGGRWSCQNGPVVALNADRWRSATPKWTGDLATYRQMLVNHEVGHLLGMRHPPAPQCPEPGRPALVMAQQSTELNGCLPNPWPLEEEVERAGRHDLPLAPPYDR